MSKVITLSRTFPSYHLRKGQTTYFVEQVLNALEIEHWEPRYLDLLININAKSIKEGKLFHDDLLRFQNSLDPLGSQNDKLHTIRAKTVKKTGEVVPRWKQGDKASLRVWAGIPYNSPQIIIAPDVELVMVGPFEIMEDSEGVNWMDIGPSYSYPAPFDMERSIIPTVAKNDGLNVVDLMAWFKYPKPFEGQILAWKEVDYI